MKNHKNSSTPVKVKMGRKEYEKELRKLQVELCRLQDWVKEKGMRVILVFEGRDGAGKGGTIKAVTERVSPACLPRRGATRSVGPRDNTDVHAALLGAFPGSRRNSHL